MPAGAGKSSLNPDALNQLLGQMVSDLGAAVNGALVVLGDDRKKLVGQAEVQRTWARLHVFPIDRKTDEVRLCCAQQTAQVIARVATCRARSVGAEAEANQRRISLRLGPVLAAKHAGEPDEHDQAFQVPEAMRSRVPVN